MKLSRTPYPTTSLAWIIIFFLLTSCNSYDSSLKTGTEKIISKSEIANGGKICLHSTDTLIFFGDSMRLYFNTSTLVQSNNQEYKSSVCFNLYVDSVNSDEFRRNNASLQKSEHRKDLFQVRMYFWDTSGKPLHIRFGGPSLRFRDINTIGTEFKLNFDSTCYYSLVYKITLVRPKGKLKKQSELNNQYKSYDWIFLLDTSGIRANNPFIENNQYIKIAQHLTSIKDGVDYYMPWIEPNKSYNILSKIELKNIGNLDKNDRFVALVVFEDESKTPYYFCFHNRTNPNVLTNVHGVLDLGFSFGLKYKVVVYGKHGKDFYYGFYDDITINDRVLQLEVDKTDLDGLVLRIKKTFFKD